MYEICLRLASFTVAVVEKSVSSKSNDKNPSDARANNAGFDSNFDLSCPNSLLDDTKPPFTNCGDNTNHRIVLLQTRRPHVQAAITLPTKFNLVRLEYGGVFLFPTLLVGFKEGSARRVFGFVMILNALQAIGVLELAIGLQFGRVRCRSS
jgi:hypothetical protein